MAVTSNAVRAGGAFVELFADDAQLRRALAGAQQRLEAFGAAVRRISVRLTALGGAITGAFGLVIRTGVMAGDVVWNLAKRVGASAEFMQGLSFAAMTAGTNVADLESGIRQMQKRAGASPEKFAGIGIDVRDQSGQLKTTERLLLEVAEALSHYTNNTEQAFLAQEIFGRSGNKMIPIIQRGAQGIRDLMMEARRKGLVASEEQINAMAEFYDQWVEIKTAVKVLTITIASAFLPTVKQIVPWLQKIIKGAQDWISRNRDLVIGVAAVGAGIFALGTALGAVAVGVTVLTMAIGAASVALGVFGSILAAILSPVGLLVAAIAGILGYFAYTSGALGKLGDSFHAVFGSLKADAIETFGAIRNAIAAGNLELAVKILWVTMRYEWQRGINWLMEKWRGFSAFFVDAFWSATFSVLRIANNFWAKLLEGAAMVAGLFSDQSAWLDEIERRRAARAAAIDRQESAAAARRRNERRRAREENEQTLARLRAERERLLREANVPGKPELAGYPELGFAVPGAGAGIGAPVLARQLGAIQSRGTFELPRPELFGAAGARDDLKTIVKNTMDVARGVFEIRDELRDNQPEFQP